MNCRKVKLLVGLGLISVSMLICQGCAANGYITASVQSVVGLDVSENPQTQVPHVRFGFIRNQYYYIPTGKVVVSGGPAGSGKADETPELVSDIYVKMEFLQSGEIKEKFAVGAVAVSTDTAKVMFTDKDKGTITFDNERQPLRIKIGNIISKNPDKAKSAKDWVIAKNSKLRDNKYPVETFVETATYTQLQELVTFLEGTQ
jgi:hypothetical protein